MVSILPFINIYACRVQLGRLLHHNSIVLLLYLPGGPKAVAENLLDLLDKHRTQTLKLR